MAKKRLALDENGNLTYCEARPENMGKGRCKHVDHQREDETNEEFLERAMTQANQPLGKYDNFKDFYDMTNTIKNYTWMIPEKGSYITGDGENDVKLIVNQDLRTFSMMVNGEVVNNHKADSYSDISNFEKYAKELGNANIQFYSTEYEEMIGAVGIKFEPSFLNKNMPYIFDGGFMEFNEDTAKYHTLLHYLDESGIEYDKGGARLGIGEYLDLPKHGTDAVLEHLKVDESDRGKIDEILKTVNNTKFSYELELPEGCKLAPYSEKEIGIEEAGFYQTPIVMEKEYLGVPTTVVGSVYRGSPT